MSGITGWTDYSKQLSTDGGIVKAMTRRLNSGGEEGFLVSEHTLLGVAAPGEDQPVMTLDGDGMYILVFNGEIYNTADIFYALEQKGHRPTSKTTGWAILHAYMEWGDEFLNRLNGVFSIALRDSARQRLILARDRLGVKTLFCHRTETGLIFASNIKALLEHPEIAPRLGVSGLSEIFTLGPARVIGSGIFEGVDELKPGTYLTFSPDGIETKSYWSLKSRPHDESFEETVLSVRELVQDAVRRQTGGDSLGFMLSGGLDSSAVCAIAASSTDAPINTYSLDYHGNDLHFTASAYQPNADAPWALRASAFLKSRHSVITLDTDLLAQSLTEAVRARDFPGMADVDSSLLLFLQQIRNHSEIAVGGECADEFFGGYPWFYRAAEDDTVFPWTRRLNQRIKLYSPELIRLIRPEEYLRSQYKEALAETPILGDEPSEEQIARRISYITITRWLPVLLERQDRISTHARLTLRAPFSDYRIADYMWNVPWNMKYRHGREKTLLRYAMETHLPTDIIRRKKSPFPKTHNPEYIDLLKAGTLKMLNDSNSRLVPLLDKTAVRSFAESMTPDVDMPWFGQLMNAPQFLAYLLQVDFWLTEYGVELI